MNLEQAVAARRSVREFEDRPVPRDAVLRAISLAVQAPAPHHSSPWRFSLLEEPEAKDSFARAMGAAWRADLASDGVPREQIDRILTRSHELLTGAPLLTVCSADLSKAHAYPDERRRLAEWSLFAHSTGAALQVYMLALAEAGIASCWISAPVFCRDVVRSELGLTGAVEPQALVLVGYPSAEYSPRPRAGVDPRDYVAGS
ncbi:MAG: nitroreductase family protein [Actinomycetota bacterium]|nr:nitroreductase family protein [Actinomycetota bacterium]